MGETMLRERYKMGVRKGEERGEKERGEERGEKERRGKMERTLLSLS